MGHAVRVGALECVCHLTADVDDLPCRHWLSEHDLRQRMALDVSIAMKLMPSLSPMS